MENGDGSGSNDDDGFRDPLPPPTANILHWETLRELSSSLRRNHEHNVKAMTLAHDIREELELGRRAHLNIATLVSAELTLMRELSSRSLIALERTLAVLERIEAKI